MGRDLQLIQLLRLIVLAFCSTFASANRMLRLENGAGSVHYAPLHVITISTNTSHPGFLAFKESVELVSHAERKINLTVIEMTEDQFWEIRWRAKLVAIAPILRSLPPNEVVILADSKDVIMLPCGRDLVADFGRLDTDIALGHCEFQHPDTFKQALFPHLPVSDPEMPFTEEERKAYDMNRFINAGIIMGRVRTLEHYIAGVFIEDGYIDNPGLDDQSFWTNMYLRQFQGGTKKRLSIVVDQGGSVATIGSNDISKVAHKGEWKSKHYRYSACIVHTPGGEVHAGPLRERFRNEWQKTWV